MGANSVSENKDVIMAVGDNHPLQVGEDQPLQCPAKASEKRDGTILAGGLRFQDGNDGCLLPGGRECSCRIGDVDEIQDLTMHNWRRRGNHGI